MLVTLLCINALNRPVLAGPAEKPAAALLPSATPGYLEISRPNDLIGLVLDHPLRQQIEQSPDFRKAVESDQFKQLLAVVALFEQRSSMKWRAALEALAGGGVVVAVDPATQGLIILASPQDAKAADAVRDALFSMARDDAAGKGGPDPIESKDYRGLTAWKVDDGYLAKIGKWLLISNSGAAAKGVADQFLDGGNSLADDKEFAEARSLALDRPDNPDRKTPPAAWGFVRLAPLRLRGIAKQLIDNKDKSDNPGAELLLGGILSDLRNSPYVIATLDAGRLGVELSLATPHDPAWVPAERKYYYAPAGGGADAPLLPKGTLLSVSTYRDLSAFWQAAPDLFDEGVAGKFAQSDSGLSTFLGGKSFSADVIGSLRPQIQIVATRQDYNAAGAGGPSIRLPAFATVMRIKAGQARTVRKAFRLAFQSLVTFANLDAASKSRPSLEASSETRGGAEVLYAAYEADDTDTKPAKPAEKSDKPVAKPGDDTYRNFSPAMVLSDEYLIVASTRKIAEDLADLIGKPADVLPGVNTLMSADGAGIGQILHEDREQLIAQNMLEKGHDRPAAEREVDLFITLIESMKDAQIRLTQDDRTVRLEIGVKSEAARD